MGSGWIEMPEISEEECDPFGGGVNFLEVLRSLLKPDAFEDAEWRDIVCLGRENSERVIRRVVESFDAQRAEVLIKVFHLRFGHFVESFMVEGTRSANPVNRLMQCVLMGGKYSLPEEYDHAGNNSRRRWYQMGESVGLPDFEERVKMMALLSSVGVPTIGLMARVIRRRDEVQSQEGTCERILLAMLRVDGNPLERQYNEYGKFPIETAIHCGKPSCVRRLLEPDPDTNPRWGGWIITVAAAAWAAYQVHL